MSRKGSVKIRLKLTMVGRLGCEGEKPPLKREKSTTLSLSGPTVSRPRYTIGTNLMPLYLSGSWGLSIPHQHSLAFGPTASWRTYLEYDGCCNTSLHTPACTLSMKPILQVHPHRIEALLHGKHSSLHMAFACGRLIGAALQ